MQKLCIFEANLVFWICGSFGNFSISHSAVFENTGQAVFELEMELVDSSIISEYPLLVTVAAGASELQ